MRAVACAVEGMYDEAIDAQLRYLELFKVRQDNIDSLRASYELGGFEAMCRTQLDLLRIRANAHYVPPQLMATTFSYLNEPDSVFYYLEKAYRERSLSLIKTWPPFHRYRGDPRYKDLLRRMNLPE